MACPEVSTIAVSLQDGAQDLTCEPCPQPQKNRTNIPDPPAVPLATPRERHFPLKSAEIVSPLLPSPTQTSPLYIVLEIEKHFQGPLNNNPALVWMVNVGELTRPDSMGSLLRISSMELMVLLRHSQPLATGRTGGGLCPTWWSQLERDWGSVCRFSAKVSGSVIELF